MLAVGNGEEGWSHWAVPGQSHLQHPLPQTPLIKLAQTAWPLPCFQYLKHQVECHHRAKLLSVQSLWRTQNRLLLAHAARTKAEAWVHTPFPLPKVCVQGVVCRGLGLCTDGPGHDLLGGRNPRQVVACLKCSPEELLSALD